MDKGLCKVKETIHGPDFGKAPWLRALSSKDLLQKIIIDTHRLKPVHSRPLAWLAFSECISQKTHFSLPFHALVASTRAGGAYPFGAKICLQDTLMRHWCF
jgi:hypothetical protein